MGDTSINKTSIAATAQMYLDHLSDWVLKPGEKINETPTSFVSLTASELGKTSAYGFFQMLMAKREINPSTAILHKSLMRQIKSDDLESIYGAPASATYMLSFPEKLIIDNALPVGNGKYKLTLNKNTVFNLANFPPFTLDFNIDIWVTKYTSNGQLRTSIYATYNVDDQEAGKLITVNNVFINTRNDIYIENQRYFSMYLTCRQYERGIYIGDLGGEAQNIDINYDNSLMGFVVLYRSTSSDTWQEINTFLEGENIVNGMNYSLNESGGQKSIRLKFNKIPGSFNPTQGTIKVVYYTTHGKEGNFVLGQIDDDTLDDLSITTNQDISDRFQEAMLAMVPTISIYSPTASGGKNAMTLEEVRTLAIESGNGEVITPATLQAAAKKRGFDSYTEQHDLLDFSYMLTSYLTCGENKNIVPTRMIKGYFNYNEIELDDDSGSCVIKPNDVFQLNTSNQLYKALKDKSIDSYSDFYKRYKENPSTDYAFPYYIRVQDGSDISVKLYDESINETQTTKFVYLSDTLLDKASITSVRVYRNPLDNTIIETSENGVTKTAKDFYSIVFTVNTSEAIVTHLKNLKAGDDPYIKFRLIFKNTTDSSMYSCDISPDRYEFDDENPAIVVCRAYIETNSNLLDTGKIKTVNNSLKNVTQVAQANFYYIDGKVDIDVEVIFKELDANVPRSASTFDKYYLTQQEIADKYYVAVVYTIENIYLAKDVSEFINIIPDVKLSQPIYKVAEEDIPDTYEENVYKTDGNSYATEASIKELPDGSQSITQTYIVLHKKGDTKIESNGRVGSFNAIGSNRAWRWSSEKDDEGVWDNGTVLGGNQIFAICQWDNLVIFAGEDGRVGCYDITYKKWHPYNDTSNYRGTNETSGYFIQNDGSAMGGFTIRGMRVMNVTSNGSTYPILFVYGDNGNVATCDLAGNIWMKYNGTGGNQRAIYYSSGAAMGGSAIYDSITYVNSKNENVIVFGGADGRMCSLNIDNGNIWYYYNREERERNRDSVFSDGKERDYKSIFAMTKYLEGAIYSTGNVGVSSVTDLTTGETTLLNDGSVVNKNSMYCCLMYGNTFVIAGKDGYIASYRIDNGSWTNYDAGAGLCDDGKAMGDEHIYAILSYGINIIVAGGNGHVASYDTTSKEWNPFDGTLGVVNDGSCVKGSISVMSFDTSQGDNIIYFGAREGNVSYKYRKGDILKDENGNYIIAEGGESSLVGYLNNIPAFNRVYAVKNSFEEIKKYYDDLITRIQAMNTVFAGGCSLHMGLKTTSGYSSTFYFNDPTTGVTTYLDSLALSFDLGIKFDENVSDEDKTYLIESVKDQIVTYVADIQDTTSNTVEFNVHNMLEAVKENVPNIEHFEFYGLNGYTARQCQTLFYTRQNDSLLNEYLSVKTMIDEETLDYNNNVIDFVPAITVTVL